MTTAVYFDRGLRWASVGEPLDLTPSGAGFKQDVATATQELARRFEDLIRQAPEQWHLLTPNWPSDRSAVPAAA
jgi:phosphatidylinositol dimannoside acyltransferase